MNDCPETYLGVKVPETLRPNWDQHEACWWRRGVRDAIAESINKENYV